jgi:hypothetical protein
MQQTGRVTVKVNGEQKRSKPGASAQMGGVQREGAMTDQGVFYYKETIVPAVVKATMPHCSDTDLLAIRENKDVTVQYTTDTGVVLTMGNAVFAQAGELQNGEVEITWTGDPLK